MKPVRTHIRFQIQNRLKQIVRWDPYLKNTRPTFFFFFVSHEGHRPKQHNGRSSVYPALRPTASAPLAVFRHHHITRTSCGGVSLECSRRERQNHLRQAGCCRLLHHLRRRWTWHHKQGHGAAWSAMVHEQVPHAA